MKAAIIQMAVREGDTEYNRQQAASMLREAAACGAKLAVLPELWASGYQLENLPELAETMRGDSVNLLRQLAREHNMFIIGGSLAEKRDGKFFNTSVAINGEGEIAAKYRKAHLYPHGLREADYFTPGDEWALADCAGLNLGLTICYDIYFPEFARNLCLRGAQILSAPVWVKESIEEFSIMARSRAVENHCFFLMANVAQKSGLPPDEQQAVGCSLIISPHGDIVAAAGGEETVLLADLEMSLLHHLRTHRNSMNDRRNILDEIDNSQI